MTRYEIIQAIIDKNKYKKYLEIGVRGFHTFNKINIDFKESVDPNVDATYKINSDDFFAQYNEKKYNIIFVDGNHNADFAYRDIINSLKHITDNGTIVCHDCNPSHEIFQMRLDHPLRIDKKVGAWNGTVWRAWLKLRSELNKQMYVVDCDHGMGIICSGTQIKIDSSLCLMEFVDFKNDHIKLLNLISVKEFKEIYENYSN